MRVDTHRHLGGCISVDFVWDVVRRQNLYYVAETLQEVREQMTFSDAEPRDFRRFLDKFKILNEIKWTAELIDESIAQVSRGLIADNIDYCWMDFSINKYMDYLDGWHKRDVIHLVRECFDRHAPGRVGLILSLKYEATRSSQRQYARLIEEEDVPNDLIGIDLVGDETYFCSDFYKPFFREWNNAGKITRAHVAESGNAENALEAILHLGVKEIAHGLAVYHRPDIMELAKDRDIGFQLALTSNAITGVWKRADWHPILALHRYGCDVMIGTDDPIQCSTNYDSEMSILGQYHEDLPAIAQYNAECRTRRYGLVN